MSKTVIPGILIQDIVSLQNFTMTDEVFIHLFIKTEIFQNRMTKHPR